MVLAYQELTEPERAVWDATEDGTPVVLPLGNPAAVDPATWASGGEDRQVRAQLLYELLTGKADLKKGLPRALKLAGARITGALDLEAATLDCAIVLRACKFEEPINLAEASLPALRLPLCRLPALHATQLATRGNLELNDGFTAEGEVNLSGAHIGGTLNLDGARFANALMADQLTVDQDFYCRGLFAEGLVRLIGARIGGSLHLTGANLTHQGTALVGDVLSVGQVMTCGGLRTTKGEIRLVGVHIGGNLELEGARLDNPDGFTLVADRLTVDGSMYCRRWFSSNGQVRMVGAHIGGQLAFENATLANPHFDEANFDQRRVALILRQVRAGSLFLWQLRPPPEGADFGFAQVGVLFDDPGSWPRQVLLRGFTYDALEEHVAVTADQRLELLRRDPWGYAPQLYEQLAAVYRRAGRDQDARAVAIANQRAHRRTLAKERGRRGILALPSWVWSLLLDGLVGYGYRTWLAVLWLLGFVLAGWWIFDQAHGAQLLIAAKPPGERPSFHAAAYSLDLLLPFADLGYQSAWIAGGWARGCYLGWTLVGWVLITAIVAALSGLIKRE